MTTDDSKYMRRALALAENGRGFASPNPMVGAVIVAPEGRIIGEGWHRVCGSAHAEVNAIASVADADRDLLRESTMYVTLEPCSHYGKTPPCAKLLVETGLRKVVIATVDPFPKVAGRGIAMLRDAGIDVEVGLMGEVARQLNRRFFTAHACRRPFVVLKWAMSADGFMDRRRDSVHKGACRFSTPLTTMSTMKLRSECDAVLTTAATVIADDCRLTVRGWHGRTPKAVLVDRHGTVPWDARIFERENADGQRLEPIIVGCGADVSLKDVLSGLYEAHGITSVLVEAGPRMLTSFIDSGLWDMARVERASFALGSDGCCPAPALDGRLLSRCEAWGENTLSYYENDSNGCEKF